MWIAADVHLGFSNNQAFMVMSRIANSMKVHVETRLFLAALPEHETQYAAAQKGQSVVCKVCRFFVLSGSS